MRYVQRIALYLSRYWSSQEIIVYGTLMAGCSLGIVIIFSAVAWTNKTITEIGGFIIVSVCIAVMSVAVIILERVGNTMLMIEADKRDRPDNWELGTLPPNFMETLAEEFRVKEEKRLKEQNEEE